MVADYESVEHTLVYMNAQVLEQPFWDTFQSTMHDNY
jgi:hypothetical protein